MSDVILNYIGPQPLDKSNADARVDVVFIHGLDGDPIKTWAASSDPADFWPRWLAQECPQANVWSLGYPSSPLSHTHAGKFSILMRAGSLLNVLVAQGIGTRPTIYVTHSLGGLLIKQILRKCHDSANPDHKRLLDSTRAIVFFGTPHQGSKLATTLATLFALIASPVVKQLVEDNEQVLDLHHFFRDWCAGGTTILAFYETKKTKQVMVVGQATADPQIAGCVPCALEGDHLSICKPQTHQAASYLAVKSLVQKAIKSSAQEKAQEPMPAGGHPSQLDLPAMTIQGLSPISEVDAAHIKVVPLPSLEAYLKQLQPTAPEIMFDYEYFTTVSPSDRRSLSEKLVAAKRSIEVADAERKKERFSMALYRHGSQSSRSRYTRLMSEVESRFNRHVRPLIAERVNEAAVNGAVQDKVITPVLAQEKGETDDITASLVESALYYLTGNCHVRWDSDEG